MATHQRRIRTATALITAAILALGTLVATGRSTATAAACPALPSSLPAASALPAISAFPDPFTLYDGTRITSSADWACRRAQLLELIQYYEYGHLPTDPTTTTATLSGSTLTVRVSANGRSSSFTATVNLPSGSGPFPGFILLNGLAASTTSRGYAQVTINPNSIAADSSAKTGAFWTLYPNSDAGALMAWAWGVHRTLDAIKAAVPQIDGTKVGVSGYSRYGKAATVAGAFDERIAMTVPGSAGTAGLGNYRFFFTNGTNDETLDGILGAPYWFTPRFATFRGQATRLPIDQHEVGALVAPRLLLATNGTEGADVRTNPQGLGITYRAAQMVYQYLGARDRIGVAYRSGSHQIDMRDYEAIMDFADKYLMGRPISRTFDSVPYPAPTTAQIPWTIPPNNPATPTPTAPTTPPPTSAPPTTQPPTSAPPTTGGPIGACSASYRQVNSWQGGFQGEVTVRAGTAALTSWSVGMSFPGGTTLTQLWNGTLSGSAPNYTVRNVSYNGSVAANGSTTFGFLGGGTASTPTLICG
ncbi:cellulose binding domain-containing protein [Actinomycetes bacterium KLBMP 9797]